MFSIIMPTYNKEDCIQNVLHSISIQETEYKFEVVILDDNSKSNPWPLIKEFTNKLDINFIRLEKNSGCKNIHSKLLEHTKYDLIIHQSSDIIYSKPNILNELMKNVKPKQPVIARVYDANFSSNAYLNFNQVISPILLDLSNGKKPGRIRSGLPNPKDDNRWYLFLGSFYKQDLIDIGYNKPFCDGMLTYKMKELNFKPQFRTDLIGLHQIHPTTIYDCPLMNKCNIQNCRPKNIKKMGINLPLYLGYESLKEVLRKNTRHQHRES